MRVLVHAYPWDVIGDPLFTARVQALGVDGVNLAAAYHAVRAATPWHPERAYLDARHSALYRPVRPEAWAGRRLVPAAPGWMDEPDSFGAAAAALTAAGVPVTAWVVLTHNSLLGEANPDVTVVNCYGQSYPWALCPSRAEVREYAATLAAEAVREAPPAGVLLEACGQLGADHGGRHDKTDGAYDARARRMLSVCCCAACRTGWAGRGVDADRVVRDLRAAVRSREHDLDPATLATLLAVRHEAADELRNRVCDTLPGLPVALHGSPDPWATGANPGFGANAGKDVDAVVVPCWPTGPESPEIVKLARRMLPADVAVGSYVTVLPPARPDDVAAHVRRLVEAGAGEIHLYHAGLAGPARHGLLAEAARAATSV
ncbi:hypothetical protein [Sphaerisporangium sp. TRM90804]|uniref:hypothetical protein n=1 Tax=Sphaerisporangium sp. TRM90804 TaxID=3031113 RepID=UPI00244D6C20|nr:hypothetical protein [Sphaerisporangium sp. TRM90804]MDH2424020.1 hypothetical protein [Sphaerisporangium sp. TRM90804]